MHSFTSHRSANKTMTSTSNKKRDWLAAVALLLTGGIWLSYSPAKVDKRPSPLATSAQPKAASTEESSARPGLHPPDATRRFVDFTPEQRVEFARRGRGPGG